MAPGRAPSVTFDKVDIPSHGGKGYLGKAEKQSNSKDAYKKERWKRIGEIWEIMAQKNGKFDLEKLEVSILASLWYVNPSEEIQKNYDPFLPKYKTFHT